MAAVDERFAEAPASTAPWSDITAWQESHNPHDRGTSAYYEWAAEYYHHIAARQSSALAAGDDVYTRANSLAVKASPSGRTLYVFTHNGHPHWYLPDNPNKVHRIPIAASDLAIPRALYTTPVTADHTN